MSPDDPDPDRAFVSLPEDLHAEVRRRIELLNADEPMFEPDAAADAGRRNVNPARQVVSEAKLPVFLLVDDVAALLRTSTKAIYAQVERGMLPGVIRRGARILFDRDVLLRELRRRQR